MADPAGHPELIRVAVDAMGGDHAPEVVIEGALRAVELPGIQVILVGPEEIISAHLPESPVKNLSVVHAPDVIGMGESPTAVAKGKPQSSIHIGIGMQRTGAADAFISAGNTGAVMAIGLFVLGRLPGVSRPALPGIFPTVSGPCVLLDVGANMDCKPEHLLQFGLMGRVFADKILGYTSPRVGLLNVGEEPGKGNEAAKAAYNLMENTTGLNFVGNIEGRDLMQHAAEVVVCDGFVGNIMLKFAESIKTVIPTLIKSEITGSDANADELAPILEGVMRKFSYEEFGGMPLLGLNGCAMIGHGGSSSKAISKMIEVAADMVLSDVRGVLADALAA